MCFVVVKEYFPAIIGTAVTTTHLTLYVLYIVLLAYLHYDHCFIVLFRILINYGTT